MNPLIPLILEFALKYGIPAARQIVELARKPEPTLEDWNLLFDRATEHSSAFLAETKPPNPS
jgi:hypothetical protein